MVINIPTYHYLFIKCMPIGQWWSDDFVMRKDGEDLLT